MQYFREASATILSQRTLNSHIWLSSDTSDPGLLPLPGFTPESLRDRCLISEPCGQQLNLSIRLRTLYWLPPVNTWREYLKIICPQKPDAPPKPSSKKAQLSVFSRFGLVSFKCSSANMNGVASLCRHSPSSCVHWWHVLCDSTPRSEHRCRTDVCYWTSEQRESSTM